MQEQAAQLEAQAASSQNGTARWSSAWPSRSRSSERLSRLKRFFSPQLAELDRLPADAEDPLESHRREVTVVFLDLRGFTAFAETAEPEEVMGVLREYHAAMGRLILPRGDARALHRRRDDGLLQRSGPGAEPGRARGADGARDARAADALGRSWRKRGIELGLGIGIAQGYATIGAIGFEGRIDYGAIGTVTNLAARLCAEAKPGQILVSQRVLCDVEELVDAEPVGELALKGFAKPLAVAEIARSARRRRD